MKHFFAPVPCGIGRFLAPVMACVAIALAVGSPATASAQAQGAADLLLELRHDWEVARYQSPPADRERLFAALATKAHLVADLTPGRAEPLVWEAMAMSAQAEEEGWLGLWTKYQLTHKAKARFESAIQINGDVLDGAAYIGLGMLYYKVPRWPVSFGNLARAGELLQKAVALHPGAIDPNYSYGEYLLETRRADQAVAYLQKALQVPIRSGYQVADTGRREEIRALLSQVKER
jgi:tetratricopeptide (TPR) repeat protein